MSDGVQEDPSSPVGVAALSRTTLEGALIGLIAAGGASLFIWTQHHLTHLLWHTLPEALGFDDAPWWLVIALLLVGATLTAAAIRLPGAGGHSPLAGLSFSIGPKHVTSVILASLAALAFGVVLGPEAPLVAIGSAAGAGIVRRAGLRHQRMMMIVGAVAAVGAIFGNPLITSILLLEILVASGARIVAREILLPSLAGLGVGYLLQVGIGSWSGLGSSQLSVPGLGTYASVQIGDVAAALVVVVIVTVLSLGARRAALAVAGIAARRPTAVLFVAAGVVGLSAVVVSAVTGLSSDMVLFSGQSSMKQYLTLAVWPGLVVLAGKFVGYVASLGGGFRGGALFPGIAMATMLAAMTADVAGPESLAALVAAAIAAVTATTMRQPVTAVLLAVLLCADAGPVVTVYAILGAVVGTLSLMLVEQFLPERPLAEPA